MARGLISDLIIDTHNEREMARHGVTPDEVGQIAENRNIVLRNPRGEQGSVLLVGETDGAAC